MAKTCSIGLKSGEYFGGAVNVTDGQTSYHRFPADLATQDIFQYTLMPTHITARFYEELKDATLVPPFDWTKQVPLLKVPVIERSLMYYNYGPGCLIEHDTRLYDLVSNPGQAMPLEDAEREEHIIDLMTVADAADGCAPRGLCAACGHPSRYPWLNGPQAAGRASKRGASHAPRWCVSRLKRPTRDVRRRRRGKRPSEWYGELSKGLALEEAIEAVKVLGALLAGAAGPRTRRRQPVQGGRRDEHDLAQPRGWPRRAPLITAAGTEAIGIKPDAVPYAFNAGSTSGGEEAAAGPAAGAPTGVDDAPAGARPNLRGLPRRKAPTVADTAAAPKTRDGTGKDSWTARPAATATAMRRRSRTSASQRRYSAPGSSTAIPHRCRRSRASSTPA